MANALYQNLAQNLVPSLLKQFGTDDTLAVIQAKIEGAYNPVTDSYDDEVMTETSVNLVLTGVKSNTIDGSLVLSGDKIALVPNYDVNGNSFEQPRPNKDKLIINGVSWMIIENMPVSPDNSVILNKYQIRKV